MDETLEDTLINRTFDACIRVLDINLILRMEAISKVRRAMKMDFAITEVYMLKLADMDVLDYQGNNYSLVD